ncbi:hypothetical protein ABH945_007221 [Paraburkholderia sp. GAS333]|uniref:hypothetical protein n=1 Tax=Paraburkholderia sp. GAS333 TaxID=3156279 RepID=UPI003D1BD2D6
MNKSTTFWIIATAFAVCALWWLLPSSTATSLILILVVIVGGALAVYGGGKPECTHDWVEIKGHRSHDIGLVVDRCTICGETRNDVR